MTDYSTNFGKGNVGQTLTTIGEVTSINLDYLWRCNIGSTSTKLTFGAVTSETFWCNNIGYLPQFLG